MIKICVAGSEGRMGSSILSLVKDYPDLEVAGSFDVGGDAETNIKNCDCLIEFTSPEATVAHAAICAKLGKAMVAGTTGLSEAEREALKKAAEEVPVVFSPNMSVGVNALFKMVEDAAKILGHEYTSSILEAHHVHKKDSPSGTAKELSRIIKAARGHVEVPIESVREDEIVGEHTVTFEGPYDLIEITHSAKTRDMLAKGALDAAKWAAGRKPGLYSMKDVLGIK